MVVVVVVVVVVVNHSVYLLEYRSGCQRYDLVHQFTRKLEVALVLDDGCQMAVVLSSLGSNY